MRFYGLKGLVVIGTMALFLVLGMIPADAIPIEVNFKAKNFSPMGTTPTSTAPPTDPVVGTIIYEAASVYADIDSLISISLKIDGYQYGISEIGYISPFSIDRQKVGGTLGQVDQIGSTTDDFYLVWYKDTLRPFWLYYTSSLTAGIWSSITFSSFSVTEANSVPEPATTLLLGSGLVGLVGLRRKKFFKN